MTETSLVYALTIVFVVLIAHAFYEYCFEHIDAILWDDKATYVALIEKYCLPTALNPEKGGGAIWNLGDRQITLFDQKIGTEPEPTIHMWTPIKLFPTVNSATVRVSEHGRQKRIANILDLMPGYLSYDPVEHRVMSRFFNLSVAQVLTMLAMKITTGEISLEEVRDDDLIFKYAKCVMPGSSEYQPAAVKKVESYIDNYVSCFC